MVQQPVVNRRMARPRRPWAIPFALALLVWGCSDEPEPAARQHGPPALSLSIPVLDGGPADMHGLVPADCIVYMQAVSLAALNDAVNQYVRIGVPNAVAEDPRHWLADLGLFDPSRVDYDRPCALAVSPGEQEFPITIILASSDAGALSRTAAPGIAVATQGDYVSFSPSGEPGPLGSPLTSDLPAGSVSGRVDLPPLVQAGRTQIELGLGLMQMQAASTPMPMGMDMAAMASAYAEMARGFMDAVESFEFTLGQDGREARLRGRLRVKPGSALGGFPPLVGGNLRDVASRVDAEAPILVLGRGDIDAVSARSHDLIRTMISAYYPDPDGQRDLDEMMGGWSALYRLSVGTMAGTFSFGAGRMGWTVIEVTNPSALVNGYRQLVEEGLMDTPMATMAVESTGMVDGVPVTTFSQTVDVDAMLAGIDDPRMLDMLEEMKKGMGIWMGSNGKMLSHFLQAEERVGMVLGSEDPEPSSSAAEALSGTPGPLEPRVAALVDVLDGHDAGIAMRMDVLAYMRSLVGAMDPSLLSRSGDRLAGSALVTLSAAVTDDDWDLDVAVDLGGLVAAFGR